ncbi:RodZ domain-containing protein [Marinobacter oulmenensis]|uniref:Cytoskeleton protein RodZ n=1 Tax=Marinobacter oulmenensis TaxID=643747 RepID=A0A840U5Z0_9GAMM|nr:RodZ domain-containing protein [Marinobacter oulmenensis]MBB5320362.1 cytoskeleton protein RodZ [Marinobacter oulmenensis]
MTDEEQSRSAPAKPVGRQLRQAREQLGLSVEAIADHQHLRSSIIQAIEAGDYTKVDTELFLKGYVRSYAVQVGLDADAVIRDLDAELEPIREEREREHQADPLIDIERRKRRKRQIAKAVIVAILLGVAGALAFNYLETEGRGASAPTLENSEAPTNDGDGSPGPEDGDAGESATRSQDVQPESLTATPAGTPDDGASFATVDDETTAADGAQTQADASGPVPPEEPAPSPEPDALLGDSSAVAQTDPEVPAQPESESFSAVVDNDIAETTEAASAAGEASLTMTFSANCWVQISDAEGNRLVSALRGPGDELNVSGPAPFSLVVGAMSAVDTLEFRGQPVDLGGFRVVNDRAEFTLEP